MSDKIPIPYPTGPREALDVNPQLLVLYGQQKVGKTECVTKLPGCLVLVLRGGSADHLAGNIMDIPRLAEAGKFGPMKTNWDEAERNTFFCDCYLRTLEDLYQRRVAGNPVAETVAHDDTGVLEEWVFDLALKSFRSTMLGATSAYSELKRVTDLPGQKGSPGWAFVWEEFDRMLWRVRRASPRSILLAHVRDKVVDVERNVVLPDDIDLTGKMRKIILREAAATGLLYRDKEGHLLCSFNTTGGTNVGAWCKHLVGQTIKLGTLDANRVTQYDWTKIYLPDAAANGGKA